MAAMLARAVRDQGRDAEALELTQLAERSAAADDVDAQVLWRAVRAPILARSGALADAEALARTALDMARQTEVPGLHASAFQELASVLQLAGRHDEARRALDEAVRIHVAKGDVVSARLARALLDA
jgi:tetratricopeptide (TPR) repeat protein